MQLERATHRFHGGLVLSHGRERLSDGPQHWLDQFGWPAILRLPLHQYDLSTSPLLVQAGQAVLANQPLTRSEHRKQVPIHAPTSGTVLGLESRAGQPYLVLAPDGRHQSVPPKPFPNWMTASTQRLVAHLQEAGLCGLGGARFPTAAKLSGPWPPPHILILNGVECEPGTGADHALLHAHCREVLIGALILAQASGARQLVLAVDDSDALLLAQLQSFSSDTLGSAETAMAERLDLRVIVVPARYPAGSERQLIEQITGQQVPLGAVPQDIGVLSHNVGTAWASYEAVVHGRPLTQRLVTVNHLPQGTTGGEFAELHCGHYWVPFGTSISQLLGTLGLSPPSAFQVRAGGPYSGLLQTDLDAPIHAGSHALLCERPAPAPQPMPCIDCGACVEVCPSRLMPQWLHKALAAGQTEQAERLHLDACIACGLCDAVCPSQLPLTAQFRVGQQAQRQRQAQAQRAALAQQRFEARQARLARAQAEQEARRQDRQARLRSRDSAQAEIAAALARAKAKSS